MATKIHDIITGIRYSVSEVEKNPKLDLQEEDFNYTETAKINGHYKTYELKAYTPNVFREIRRACNISTDEFLDSWAIPPLENAEDHQMSQSTGRSGSNFYKTPDHKFFFKTLIHAEVAAMMQMTRPYLEHLRKYPRSFIMRMYALFRIKHMGDKIWIVIMGNVFPQPFVKIDEKYDLKGRKPKPGKSVKERPPLSKDALKDNEINRKFYLEEDEYHFYVNQLTVDVNLLKLHNVMDYSLLVGVHVVTPQDVEQHDRNLAKINKRGSKYVVPREERSPYEWGGLRGGRPDGKDYIPEVYFIGIIDCLTNYYVFKVMANKMKSVLWDDEMLSTVPSDFYADRFLKFMTKKIIEMKAITSETINSGPVRSIRLNSMDRKRSSSTSTDLQRSHYFSDQSGESSPSTKRLDSENSYSRKFVVTKHRRDPKSRSSAEFERIDSDDSSPVLSRKSITREKRSPYRKGEIGKSLEQIRGRYEDNETSPVSKQRGYTVSLTRKNSRRRSNTRRLSQGYTQYPTPFPDSSYYEIPHRLPSSRYENSHLEPHYKSHRYPSPHVSPSIRDVSYAHHKPRTDSFYTHSEDIYYQNGSQEEEQHDRGYTKDKSNRDDKIHHRRSNGHRRESSYPRESSHRRESTHRREGSYHRESDYSREKAHVKRDTYSREDDSINKRSFRRDRSNEEKYFKDSDDDDDFY